MLFNRNYAETLDDRDIAGGELRRTSDGLWYRHHEHGPPPADHFRSNAHWPHFSLRPSVLRPDAIRALGPFPETPGFELDFAHRYAAAGLRSGFFDLTTCVHTGRRTDGTGTYGATSAYHLAGRPQWAERDPAGDGATAATGR